MKIRILIFIAIVTSMLMLFSCAGPDAITYEISSPSVALGEPLSAEDFVKITSGTAAVSTGYPVSTAKAGSHAVVVTVTPEEGSPLFVNCSYSVASPVITEITAELGDPLPSASDYLNRDMLYSEFGIENADEFYSVSYETDPVEGVLGTQSLTLRVDAMTFNVSLNVQDTTPPEADPVSMILTNGMHTPTPDSFVGKVRDASEVTLAFAEEYDFSYPHDFDVSIILTDACGNSSVVTATVHCLIDKEPPVITVEGDLYVTIGKTVSYKGGVTATDNSGDPTITIDNSAVDLNTKGIYEIVYTATDKAGNSTSVVRRLFVVEELPPEESEVLRMAEDVYNNYIVTREGMTKFEIARAIYDWCYNSITFDMKGTDRSLGPIKLAYDGFSTLKGDCYTYMITAKYLFLIADIPTVEVTRLRYEGESNHFWLLIDIGDGWYHFDATSRSTGRGTDTFMLTDEELAEFCTRFNVPHYFRFQHDAYPERATDSYFD